jgi:hypothetical protein
MNRGPEFFKQMTREQVDQLERFADAPGRTAEECRSWLADLGVEVPSSTMYRWFQDFRAWAESVRRGEFCRALIDAKNTDPDAVHEATLQLLDAAVLDKLVSGEPLTPKDLKELAATRSVSSKERAELRRVRAENAAAKKAIAEGEAKGKSAVDVVATIKEALGITTKGQP